MLYHYTDRLTAADIRRDGVIRGRPIVLHRDLLARDEGLTTPPLVWLTINPILDGTVVTKLVGAGWPKTLVGDLWRFVVAEDYPCEALVDYVESSGIEHDWWTCMVQTGHLAGSDYTTWRLCGCDIPASDWLAVQVLKKIDDDIEWENA